MRHKQRFPAEQCGFTLIELMVGMVIGMAVVLAMGQVMSVNEGYKRTTMFGNDSMVNGALALNMIERDGKNAGFGGIAMIQNLSGSGCEVRMKNSTGNSTLTLTAVEITDGAGGAPDSIRFISSNSSGVALPIKIEASNKDDIVFQADSVIGIEDQDLMIAVPPGCNNDNWASVFQVTSLDILNNKIKHDPSPASEWNHSGANNIFPENGYPEDSYIINMGKPATMNNHVYSIVNNGLQLQDAATTQIVFPQIIQLQAEYGVDTNDDQTVDNWSTAAPANWTQVKAVRLALVSRSAQWQKDVVTTDEEVETYNLTWWGRDIEGVDLNTGNNRDDDWKHYRYQVFETVIPLRNLIWQKE